jgi:hypothetical protein
VNEPIKLKNVKRKEEGWKPNTNIRCVTTPKSEDLIYTTTKA